MGRIKRIDLKNYYYHILNRANGRMQIFNDDEDYKLFEEILFEAKKKFDMRIVAYCIMPNHFHLVLNPKENGDIQKFMQWLTLTHTQRLHSKNKTIGYGHIYQGRYKSFLVDSDDYLKTLLLYVEQNPLRAGLVNNLKKWKWGSYFLRNYGNEEQKKLLSSHYYQTTKSYDENINIKLKKEVTELIAHSIDKSKPFGSKAWVDKIIEKFDLRSVVRGRGRPKKNK